MTKEEIINEYGFDTASPKWIPKGGELLKYIGQDVVFVDFKKTEEGTWTSGCRFAKILQISNFNPVTMTYRVKYTLDDGKERYETIIPEGFSFDIAGGGLQTEMCRFTPESLHMKCVEEEVFYRRLSELWDKKKTLSINSLQTLSSSKEKHKTLTYCKHVAVVGKTDEGLTLYFRLFDFKMKPVKGGMKELTLVDSEKRVHVITVPGNDVEEYTWSGVGKMKIIDLEE